MSWKKEHGLTENLIIRMTDLTLDRIAVLRWNRNKAEDARQTLPKVCSMPCFTCSTVKSSSFSFHSMAWNGNVSLLWRIIEANRFRARWNKNECIWLNRRWKVKDKRVILRHKWKTPLLCACSFRASQTMETKRKKEDGNDVIREIPDYNHLFTN